MAVKFNFNEREGPTLSIENGFSIFVRQLHVCRVMNSSGKYSMGVLPPTYTAGQPSDRRGVLDEIGTALWVKSVWLFKKIYPDLEKYEKG